MEPSLATSRSKLESNDSPKIPDRRETRGIRSLPSGKKSGLGAKAYRALAAIQDTAPGDSAGRATVHAANVCTRTLATHVHSSPARAVPYMAKSRDARTDRQNAFIQRVVRLRRYFGVVMLLVLMQQCWRVKKRPTKEVVRFGVESALNYRPR